MANNVQKPLGKAGMAFFGSLCLGTFGLGVWQTKRYFEKVQEIEERDRRMSLPPSEDVNAIEGRIRLKGIFDHSKEFYVGPRGSPLSQATGSIGVPKQGYFVWTPMTLTSVPGQAVVLVNRGWVLREKVDNNRQTNLQSKDPNKEQAWGRPNGELQLMAVRSKAEAPRFLVPQHVDLSSRKLFWMDQQAMTTLGELPFQVPLFTQIDDEGGYNHDLTRPSVDSVARPKVTPAVHAGYAVTWYGLSLAGLLLTRKLILRR